MPAWRRCWASSRSCASGSASTRSSPTGRTPPPADGANFVLVDAHAEATSEKEALGYHLAGRAHAVLGTHTHVPTADARVLAGGTAYVTDVGMTGRAGSIIGFDREHFIGLFLGERRDRIPVASE